MGARDERRLRRLVGPERLHRLASDHLSRLAGCLPHHPIHLHRSGNLISFLTKNGKCMSQSTIDLKTIIWFNLRKKSETD